MIGNPHYSNDAKPAKRRYLDHAHYDNEDAPALCLHLYLHTELHAVLYEVNHALCYPLDV